MSIVSDIQARIGARSWIENVSTVVAQHGNFTAVDEATLKRLRKHFASGMSEQKDGNDLYNSASGIFFLRYGLGNLLKNYYAISELFGLGILRNVRKVLDIGSGPGTFAFAYMLWAKAHPSECRRPLSIVMADSAHEPLVLFDTIWKHTSTADQKAIKITKVHRSCTTQLPDSDDADLIVFSNSIVEILRNKECNQENLLRSLLRCHATVLVIDHPYQEVQSLLSNFSRTMNERFECVSLYRWQRWQNTFDDVNLNRVEYRVRFSDAPCQQLSSNVRFLKAVFRPKGTIECKPLPWMIRIVLKYKDAWERHDTNLLRDLFTRDASYREKPNAEPMKGIERICAYWRENAQKQRHVRFVPKFVDFDQDALRVHWECTFYRVDLKRWLFLRGFFDAKFAGNRICSFSEEFLKQTTALPLPWARPYNRYDPSYSQELQVARKVENSTEADLPPSVHR